MASKEGAPVAINPEELSEVPLDDYEGTESPKINAQAPETQDAAAHTEPTTDSQDGHATNEPTDAKNESAPHDPAPQTVGDATNAKEVDGEASAQSLAPATNGQSKRVPSTPSSPASRQRRSASIRRSRNASIALAHTTVNGAVSLPAKVFIQKTFEEILSSKDAKRIPALKTATELVLEKFKQSPDQLPPPKMVLEPLRLVCVPPGTSNELKEVALKTLAQVFSLNYLGIVEDEASQTSLLADAVNIVSDSWEAEGADQRVEVQIIRALDAAVANEELVVHGSVLMRAVRQVYHIFVVTRSQSNQSLAQASLTQMVHHVFDRVKNRCVHAANPHSGSASSSSINGTGNDNETRQSSPEPSNEPGDATLTLKQIQSTPLPDMDDSHEDRTELENITQDAGLLFRTLCRLSMKVIDESDVKSQPMRSKLLSLHLLHMILKHHISVFSNKRITVRKSRSESEPFAYAIKPYLRQAMAQNALSPVAAAFEITVEIFWLILDNLRSEFKPELAVFFTEVYFTAMDMRTATMHQRLFFMTILSRICTDPRLLVELYLNYDCDPAAPNVFEKLMELVSRMALKPAVEPSVPLTRMSIDRQHIRVYDLNAPPAVAIAHLVAASSTNQSAGMLTSAATAQQQQTDRDNYQLKMAALESMVNVLRSLVLWSQRRGEDGSGEHAAGGRSRSGTTSTAPGSKHGSSIALAAGGTENGSSSLARAAGHQVSDSISSFSSSTETDDPDQFASRKHSKRILDAAIQEFNFNPSRGLAKFVEAGLLHDPANATEVAKLLLKTDGLDKIRLGDFLGKDANQEVMVEFINAMDFHGLTLVQALRNCLQEFRLPGEGQIIDRYMQTFAKKYFDDNSVDGIHPDLASADAAWVLAMSVMMLNTDLHASALQKRRMSDEQFIKNNKGMNDGVDFRAELLMDIYREIKNNEIKLESERAEVAIKDKTYEVASDAITARATQFFQTTPSLEFEGYYNASHAAHIRPMFELSWLAVLAGISNPFSQLKDTMALNACLEGLELALKIACHFDVDLARVSFVQTLAQATLLAHPENMAWKNVGAIHALFRVSLTEGDSLRDSWYDVLVVVLQVEKAQLLARESASSNAYPRDISDALLSRELVVDIDRIFTNTQDMTNEGAVYFVKALSRVSLEEIDNMTSGEPRLFALQKMVDVCYYNSARIRMGWSELWDAAMAEQFAKVLVHKNDKVVMFALDSLRQLSTRFLEIDEMPHFAFQQEFLAPFSHALRHNRDVRIQIFALECLMQMVMTRGDKLKSGWEAIFGAVREAAAAESSVVDAAYSLLVTVPTTSKVPPGYLEACSAIAEQPQAKTALRAVELLHQLVESHKDDMPLCQRVFVRFSEIAMKGQDLEVRGRCLEVLFKLLNDHGRVFARSDWDEVFTRSLGPLFSVLHGQTKRRAGRSPHRSPQRTPAHSPERSRDASPERGSDSVERRTGRPSELRQTPSQLQVPHVQLAPPASASESTADLSRSRSPSPSRSRLAREDMSLWLSSTLIQALKSLVSLFTTYFDMLEHALDPFFLELLRTCILQENDPVSRMGNSCLQLIIQDNAERFSANHWHLIASKLVQLFKDTTATSLTDRSVLTNPHIDTAELFRSMTAKTMQALLVISTSRDLLVGSKGVFDAIPVVEMLRITARLRMSYTFAREFNRQNDLRHELYQRGFFRQTPNLLHQESQAARTYISVSMRLFKASERFETDPSARQDVSEELMAFCAQVMSDYNRLKESEPRHISKMLPILESALRHISEFEDSDFEQLVPVVYPQVVNILNKGLTVSLREEVRQILKRVGDVWVLKSKETVNK